MPPEEAWPPERAGRKCRYAPDRSTFCWGDSTVAAPMRPNAGDGASAGCPHVSPRPGHWPCLCTSHVTESDARISHKKGRRQVKCRLRPVYVSSRGRGAGLTARWPGTAGWPHREPGITPERPHRPTSRDHGRPSSKATVKDTGVFLNACRAGNPKTFLQRELTATRSPEPRPDGQTRAEMSRCLCTAPGSTHRGSTNPHPASPGGWAPQ